VFDSSGKLSNEIGIYRKYMRKLFGLVCLALLLSFAPFGSSAPNGIGSAGDNGCTCHGGALSVPNNESFDFTVEGIPINFTLNTSYSITITMDNGSLVDNNANGYRIIASQGEITTDLGDADSHIMDEGATQTADGQSTNVWNLTWTSPSEADGDVEFNTFVLVGSGAGTTGDYWIGKTNTSSPVENNSQEEEEPEEIPFVGMSATASVIALAFAFKRDEL